MAGARACTGSAPGSAPDSTPDSAPEGEFPTALCKYRHEFEKIPGWGLHFPTWPCVFYRQFPDGGAHPGMAPDSGPDIFPTTQIGCVHFPTAVFGFPDNFPAPFPAVSRRPACIYRQHSRQFPGSRLHLPAFYRHEKQFPAVKIVNSLACPKCSSSLKLHRPKGLPI